MAKTPQRDTERDQSLIDDYQAINEDGSYTFSVTELVAKYQISSTRIHQILDHYKITKRSGYDRQPKPKKRTRKAW